MHLLSTCSDSNSSIKLYFYIYISLLYIYIYIPSLFYLSSIYLFHLSFSVFSLLFSTLFIFSFLSFLSFCSLCSFFSSGFRFLLIHHVGQLVDTVPQIYRTVQRRYSIAHCSTIHSSGNITRGILPILGRTPRTPRGPPR